MESLRGSIMVAGVVGGFHNDVVDYLTRFKNDNGVILPKTIIELNNFVNWHYRVGLRNNNNVNHIVKVCGLYVGQSLNGYRQCLWHTATNKMTNISNTTNLTYSASTGLKINANNNNGFTLNYNVSNVNLNNVSIGVYDKVYSPAEEYFGFESSATNRLLLHHPWSDNTTYYDNGSYLNNRVQANLSTVPGLTIGRRSGTSQSIVFNGVINATGTSTVSVSVSGEMTLTSREGYVGTGNKDKFIGGFFIGEHIANALLVNHYTAWKNLQDSTV